MVYVVVGKTLLAQDAMNVFQACTGRTANLNVPQTVSKGVAERVTDLVYVIQVLPVTIVNPAL